MKKLRKKLIIRFIISLVYLVIPVVLMTIMYRPDIQKLMWGFFSYYVNNSRNMYSVGEYKSYDYLFYFFAWFIASLYILNFLFSSVGRFIYYLRVINIDKQTSSDLLENQDLSSHNGMALTCLSSIIIFVIILSLCDGFLGIFIALGVVSIWFVFNKFLSLFSNPDFLFKRSK